VNFMPDGLATLDRELLAAHAAGDMPALVRLYAEAAEACEAEGQSDAAGFYRTHAYVFALALGDARAGALHAKLKADGREQ